MTRPGYCDITLLIDRSGSMAAFVDEFLTGYAGFLADQQQLPVGQLLTWSVSLFDHDYRSVQIAQPIAQVLPLDRLKYQPRGNTALWDAWGRCIDETGLRLRAMPEPERPSQVLFITITDGIENASDRYTPSQLQQMVDLQRSRYLWQFAFLGANQDVTVESERLGLRPGEFSRWTASTLGVQEMFRRLSERTTLYRRAAQSPVPQFFPTEGGRLSDSFRRRDAVVAPQLFLASAG